MERSCSDRNRDLPLRRCSGISWLRGTDYQALTGVLSYRHLLIESDNRALFSHSNLAILQDSSAQATPTVSTFPTLFSQRKFSANHPRKPSFIVPSSSIYSHRIPCTSLRASRMHIVKCSLVLISKIYLRWLPQLLKSVTTSASHSAPLQLSF